MQQLWDIAEPGHWGDCRGLGAGHKETGTRRGDGETRRQGDKETKMRAGAGCARPVYSLYCLLPTAYCLPCYTHLSRRVLISLNTSGVKYSGQGPWPRMLGKKTSASSDRVSRGTPISRRMA